ncbi:hypothetical protein [Paenibacillus sp. SI8]|uniref:hypothetical protein n=1 Tax=unclassified Paenibacillus TaxID=185978 RepID=UPI00346576B9
MTKLQLNNLIIAYKTTRCQGTFRAIFDEFEPQWKRSVRFDAKRTCTDEAEMIALYHDSLWKAIEKWDSARGDFANYLSRWINRARSNLQRTNLRRLSKCINRTVRKEDDDEDAPTSVTIDLMTDGISAEDLAIERMHKKKEADQISLIDFLSDRANDPVTTLIVTETRTDKGKSSITVLAKALGHHHETVRRKLTALSRHYDANRFGDVRDYLAV